MLRRSPDHKPVSVKALAEQLPAEAWQIIPWREGTNIDLTSRFAAVRLSPASRDDTRSEPHVEEWLMIEWPDDEAEPTKYWLSTMPPETAIEDLVQTTKLRWRIECDYQDLKQELGLGHYEGRGWRGFHHHASLCIAAYGFLIALRGIITPSAPARPKSSPTPHLPPVSNPAAPPVRPERHVLTSIATMRRQLTLALIQRLSRCPCCNQSITRRTLVLMKQ